jgi:hypothetical protein
MPSFWQSTALAQGLPRAGKTYHGRAYLELEPQPQGAWLRQVQSLTVWQGCS